MSEVKEGGPVGTEQPAPGVGPESVPTGEPEGGQVISEKLVIPGQPGQPDQPVKLTQPGQRAFERIQQPGGVDNLSSQDAAAMRRAAETKAKIAKLNR